MRVNSKKNSNQNSKRDSARTVNYQSNENIMAILEQQHSSTQEALSSMQNLNNRNLASIQGDLETLKEEHQTNYQTKSHVQTKLEKIQEEFFELSNLVKKGHEQITDSD